MSKGTEGRSSFLKRMGLGALAAVAPFVVSSAPVAEEEAYQFATVLEDETPLVGAVIRGAPTFNALQQAAKGGFNYMWRYVYRGGVRHVDGMRITL